MIAVFLPRTATASTDNHFGRPRLRSRRDDDQAPRASGAQAGETRAPPGDALGTRASGAQAGETRALPGRARRARSQAATSYCPRMTKSFPDNLRASRL